MKASDIFGLIIRCAGLALVFAGLSSLWNFVILKRIKKASSYFCGFVFLFFLFLRQVRQRVSEHIWQKKQSLQLCFLSACLSGTWILPSPLGRLM
jgi:hypothetical protein